MPFNQQELHTMIIAPVTTAELAILAAIFIILVGAGLMPALVILGKFAVNEAVSTVRNELIKWVIMTAAALALALSATPAPAAAAEKPAVIASADLAAAPSFGTALDTAITQAFARVVATGAKKLPVWLADAAARIYAAYRIHQVSKKADEAARIALAGLTELAHVRAEIEAGRMLTEQEQRATRIRLEAQAAEIEGLVQRVTVIEQRTKRLEQRTEQVARVTTRPGCPELHAWDRKLGRCTNRQ